MYTQCIQSGEDLLADTHLELVVPLPPTLPPPAPPLNLDNWSDESQILLWINSSKQDMTPSQPAYG